MYNIIFIQFENFDKDITSTNIETTLLYKFCKSNGSLGKKAEGYKFTLLDVIDEEEEKHFS